MSGGSVDGALRLRVIKFCCLGICLVGFFIWNGCIL